MKKNVVGVDIKFHEPNNSDLIIDNNIKTKNFNKISNKLIEFIKKKNKSIY